MVASGDDEPCMRQNSGNDFEAFEHELQPLVGSPFSKCKNAVLGISSPRKVRILRPCRQNAMGTEMHIVAPVFFVQDLSIAGHQYGD